MTSSFVSPDNAAWERALEACPHDLYHLPGYVAVEAEWVGADPRAFLYEEGGDCMLLPLLLRPTPEGGTDGYVDATSPYGYSPPVFSANAPQAFQRRALTAYDAAARHHRIVSSFIRLHPFLEGVPMDEVAAAWSTVDHGVTVDLPIDTEESVWLSRIGKDHRTDIRRLRSIGYRFERDTSEAIAEFTPVYLEEMTRLGASPAYRYTAAYIERFRALLLPFIHFAAIRSPSGDIACAGIFSIVDGIMQYHLSGTRSEHRKHSPMKLLLAEMRQVARERGVRRFHLGGGVGARHDALFVFKARFGGTEYPFRTLHAVHDAERFAHETGAWIARAGNKREESGGFFPPYRAPLEATP